MKYVFTVEVDTDKALARRVHGETAGAVGDLLEREHPEHTVRIGRLTALGTPADAVYVAAAQERWGDHPDVVVPDGAEVTRAGQDVFVAARVRVDQTALVGTVLDADPERQAAMQNDALVIEAARGVWEEEGQLEIDDNAVVSYSTDDGAYVAAWVWVNNSVIHAAGATNPETDQDDQAGETQPDAADSEGGHCD